jgi:hypothetical protein
VSFGTREELEILLLRVLKRMDVHNLRMQPVKCEFLRHEVAFLGHVHWKDGILRQDSKISAIKNWPPLTDVRSVRAFVSLCSYYRKYIWRFTEISTPGFYSRKPTPAEGHYGTYEKDITGPMTVSLWV